MAGFDEIQWSGEVPPIPTPEPEPRLTRAQRAADALTLFCGSWSFVFIFAVLTIGWVLYNTLPGITPFDVYPYILLNLFFTVVELYQGPVILMSQNREMERDREAVRGLHEKLDRILARLG